MTQSNGRYRSDFIEIPNSNQSDFSDSLDVIMDTAKVNSAWGYCVVVDAQDETNQKVLAVFSYEKLVYKATD